MADLPVLHDLTGTPRVLAALPPHPWQPIPRMAAARVLPREQWREVDYSALAAPPLDQGRSSSCTGHMAATTSRVAWALKTGRQVDFSGTFNYGLCSGGRDQGAVISDVVTSLTTQGICLASECPEGVFARQQIPQPAFATAARYKLSRWHHTPSFDEICTALSLGWPCGIGVLVGQNMMRVGASGVCPVPDYVVGGHALALVGLKRVNGQWMPVAQNSWTSAWGDRGYGYLSEAFVNYTVQLTRQQWGAPLDAFASEYLADAPDDPDVPPLAAE
jgi:hypothetical protein